MLMFILFICISFSFLKCMLLFSHSVVSISFATPWIVTHQAPRSMGFPSQEDWMGCYFLLQGIFPTQVLNLGLLHCRQILYCLSHQGSPSTESISKENLVYPHESCYAVVRNEERTLWNDGKNPGGTWLAAKSKLQNCVITHIRVHRHIHATHTTHTRSCVESNRDSWQCWQCPFWAEQQGLGRRWRCRTSGIAFILILVWTFSINTSLMCKIHK